MKPLAFFILFCMLIQVASAAQYSGFSSNGEVVLVEINKATFLSIGPLAIWTTPSVIPPGSQFKINFGMSIPCGQGEPSKINVQIYKDAALTNLYDQSVISLSSSVGSCSSQQMSITMTAPTQGGTYYVYYAVATSGGVKLVDESRAISVNSNVVCPPASCTDWSEIAKAGLDGRGSVQMKECQSYPDSSCSPKIEQSYRTICDAGWIVPGQNVQQSVGQQFCIPAVVGQPYCGDSACNNGETDNTCPQDCPCSDCQKPTPQPTPDAKFNFGGLVNLILIGVIVAAVVLLLTKALLYFGIAFVLTVIAVYVITHGGFAL